MQPCCCLEKLTYLYAELMMACLKREYHGNMCDVNSTYGVPLSMTRLLAGIALMT
jgi:hypothetical protein